MLQVLSYDRIQLLSVLINLIASQINRIDNSLDALHLSYTYLTYFFNPFFLKLPLILSQNLEFVLLIKLLYNVHIRIHDGHLSPCLNLRISIK